MDFGSSLVVTSAPLPTRVQDTFSPRGERHQCWWGHLVEPGYASWCSAVCVRGREGRSECLNHMTTDVKASSPDVSSWNARTPEPHPLSGRYMFPWQSPVKCIMALPRSYTTWTRWHHCAKYLYDDPPHVPGENILVLLLHRGVCIQQRPCEEEDDVKDEVKVEMNSHKTLPLLLHELFHDRVREDRIFFFLHCDLKLGEGGEGEEGRGRRMVKRMREESRGEGW